MTKLRSGDDDDGGLLDDGGDKRMVKPFGQHKNTDNHRLHTETIDEDSNFGLNGVITACDFWSYLTHHVCCFPGAAQARLDKMGRFNGLAHEKGSPYLLEARELPRIMTPVEAEFVQRMYLKGGGGDDDDDDSGGGGGGGGSGSHDEHENDQAATGLDNENNPWHANPLILLSRRLGQPLTSARMKTGTSASSTDRFRAARAASSGARASRAAVLAAVLAMWPRVSSAPPLLTYTC